MKSLRTALLLLYFVSAALTSRSQSQKLIFSQPDKTDLNNTSFDVMGKFANNILVLKSCPDSSFITVYNNEMVMKDHVNLSFIPDSLVATDIVAYNDFSYLFYQSVNKNRVYTMMAKIGANGHPLEEPELLDSASKGMGTIYSVVTSENKQHIMLFKVEGQVQNTVFLKTLLFNKEMELQYVSAIRLEMNNRFDYLSDFLLDNSGNLAFCYGLGGNLATKISRFYLVEKPATNDQLTLSMLEFDNVLVKSGRLSIDNHNNRFLFTGFYFRKNKDNPVEGFVNAVFDRQQKDWISRNIVPLNNDMREDARAGGPASSAFNSYNIRQVIIKKDGGFMLVTESAYESLRRGGFINMNSLYSVDMSSNAGFYRYGFFWSKGSNHKVPRRNSATYYYAGNIMIVSFNKEGAIELGDFVHKKQDDNQEMIVGYQLINSQNNISFLYNDFYKRDKRLALQSISPDGKITRHPAITSIERYYQFYPKLARQVSSNTVIVPCAYKSQLTFAKINLN